MFSAPSLSMQESKMISIIDLADEIGVRKQTIFKVARRLGIETQNDDKEK